MANTTARVVYNRFDFLAIGIESFRDIERGQDIRDRQKYGCVRNVHAGAGTSTEAECNRVRVLFGGLVICGDETLRLKGKGVRVCLGIVHDAPGNR